MDTLDIATLSPQDLAKLRFAIADVRGWLDLKVTTGRYAFGFILELARHQMARCYNVHTIYDEIGILEGADARRSITKAAEPFKGEILRGLWHKHHHQAGFIARNLLQEMSRPGAMREVLKPYFGRYMGEVAGEISHAMTIGAYTSRAQDCRMTGEWIVYEPGPTGNYYLALGQHPKPGEDRRACDEELRIRIESYREIDGRIAAMNR